ncbi:hypothetical protein COU88_00040 [Candidatus Roizmanbacteria bacterium CG10_big_fil_rev_8_21_14_0_10_39_6]|uniref:Uncharacterized protein n=1 Tax=Candidatus Roizmanbacteria bacterium CG10_big_fil_rev_8_21_14_0_10_39_6 TaxID=1974853 RepID=A0A2M8KTU0_9BACT|nr:MAG: hypothetical protein COU88_00040 [Candidatus Roizmanbacteria bacterium CG10_big_fil_rev_8_21_14_0_10_39_6]
MNVKYPISNSNNLNLLFGFGALLDIGYWILDIKSWVFSIYFLALLFVLAPSVGAIDMSSSSYRIIFGTLNSGGSRTTSSGYKLDISLGQVAAAQFNSSGYVVKAGFQYARTLTPFSFTLSDTSLDLGTLLPNTFSTQQLSVTVNHRGVGYEIATIADTRLKQLFGSDEIPDTSCNGGPDTCTETSAALWNSTGTYGFGYNASGDDVSSDFTSSSYFRPFPTKTDAEPAATFMSSNATAIARSATVTVKANIQAIQTAGNYQTVLSFIAIPKY